MIRWGLELFPGAADWASPTIMALAVVSIVYGALAAIGSTDIRRLVAYTSVSHFGFIILGIFAFNYVFTQTLLATQADLAAIIFLLSLLLIDILNMIKRGKGALY